MNAGKRTPGPWATGLANLTPIEAMRQDRKKLVAKMETLTAERAALREALESAAASLIQAGTDIRACAPLAAPQFRQDIMFDAQEATDKAASIHAALALVDGGEK